MVNDPIADFLIRLTNASRVGHSSVSVPFSQMKYALAQLLSKEGYVGSVAHQKESRTFDVELKYVSGVGSRPAILGAKRISKPSRRLYMGVRDIRSVKHGHGLLVLSTPMGVLSDKDARKNRVGGEALFEIW